MKSPSIETIYAQFNKHILLAQSYCEIKELSFIIKSCRFKPYSFIFENKNSKLQLHNWWFDEYGNSLKITNDKNIKLIFNDLNLKYNRIISTDLYYGLSIDKVVKFSKLAYLCLGKDEDTLEDYCMISLLGIDNYLRTYVYIYGEWNQVPSILLGINNLKSMSRYLKSKEFLELKIKENIPNPCVSGRAWLTYLPASEEFIELIGKQNDIVIPMLRNK